MEWLILALFGGAVALHKGSGSPATGTPSPASPPAPATHGTSSTGAVILQYGSAGSAPTTFGEVSGQTYNAIQQQQASMGPLTADEYNNGVAIYAAAKQTFFAYLIGFWAQETAGYRKEQAELQDAINILGGVGKLCQGIAAAFTGNVPGAIANIGAGATTAAAGITAVVKQNDQTYGIFKNQNLGPPVDPQWLQVVTDSNHAVPYVKFPQVLPNGGHNSDWNNGTETQAINLQWVQWATGIVAKYGATAGKAAILAVRNGYLNSGQATFDFYAMMFAEWAGEQSPTNYRNGDDRLIIGEALTGPQFNGPNNGANGPQSDPINGAVGIPPAPVIKGMNPPGYQAQSSVSQAQFQREVQWDQEHNITPPSSPVDPTIHDFATEQVPAFGMYWG